jgi:hypothetical protein
MSDWTSARMRIAGRPAHVTVTVESDGVIA